MPSDETSLLMPEVNSLNWRRKCCKHFSRGSFLWIVYALLLVTEVAVALYIISVGYFKGAIDASNERITSDGTTSSPGPHFFSPTVPSKQDPGNETADNSDFAEMLFAAFIVVLGINTLNCWIFLGIVVTSPRFVGCLTTLKNLIRLPKFWTLLFLLALYTVGRVIIHYPGKERGIHVGYKIVEALNAFTMVAMVATLNNLQIQNLVQGNSRYKRLLLKGALVIFFCYSFGVLILVIFSVFFSKYVSNSDKDDTLTTPLTDFLLLPFDIKMTNLIWTKIFHDDECIIGKPNSNSFTRQMTQV